MRVRDIMTTDVKVCGPETDLAAVAQIMWDNDCGIVPVTTESGRVLGLLTDRDICIAAATRHSSPAELRAGDALSQDVHTCAPGDDISTALGTMSRHQVRRLPVLDADDTLCGLLSLNDVLLYAGRRGGADISDEEVVQAMKAVGAHRAHSAAASV